MNGIIIRSPTDYQQAIRNLMALQAEGRGTTDMAVRAVVEAIEHYESVTRLWDKNPAAAVNAKLKAGLSH